ncbi:MAG: nucleotidyl transferase AbiEii/AbiGii toxin family protein [Bacteroidota bacterium]|nr:nucleotidyl transferase AbiEii/AbiGii toxin family protein [Bacteroidota bacterium]
MIPKPYIAQWKEHAPWKEFAQIEQDLIISRALVSLFKDEFLREKLAFCGGTALHKLYLNPASRYSEDIDLVQIKEGAIGDIIDKIDEILDFFEIKKKVKQTERSNTIIYRFNSEYEERPLKLKIEINCREHFNILKLKEVDYQVNNKWFSGKAKVVTYDINELLGSKLRALYQRKKGRDLFDLFYASQNITLNNDQLIKCYNEYIKVVVDTPPTKRLFLQNIEEKETDTLFLGDIEGLLRPQIEYNPKDAFKWIKAELIEKMKE